MSSGNPINGLSASSPEEIQRQLNILSSRDPQLWSIAVLLILVVASGLLAVRDPHLISQVFFGLVALIALLNVHLVAQRRVLLATRWQLINELSLNDTLARASYMDPLTLAINRQSMDIVVGRELTRANRLGSSLTFLLLEVRNPRAHASTHPDRHIDSPVLAAAGKLLRTTFRGLDIVVRYSEHTFLIAMPDTNQQQAEIALRRLATEIDTWNLSSATGVEVTFDHGMASYVKGAHAEDVIRSAARSLSLKRNEAMPFFDAFTPGAAASQTSVCVGVPVAAHQSQKSRAMPPELAGSARNEERA